MNLSSNKSILATGSMAAVLGAFALVGCGADPGSTNDDHGWGDAGIASRDYNKSHIVNQPDGFGNISIKCDGKYGYMMFMVTHSMSDTPVVVVPDPRCPGYRKDLMAPGQPATGGAPRPPEE